MIGFIEVKYNCLFDVLEINLKPPQVYKQREYPEGVTYNYTQELIMIENKIDNYTHLSVSLDGQVSNNASDYCSISNLRIGNVTNSLTN